MHSELYDNTLWWISRLIEHHGTSAKAFNAQVRHIGAEYGEMLDEIQKLFGDNPRRPEIDESAAGRVLDELGDIVITSLITMALAYRAHPEHRDCVDAALAKLCDRFDFVTDRMKEFDRSQ